MPTPRVQAAAEGMPKYFSDHRPNTSLFMNETVGQIVAINAEQARLLDADRGADSEAMAEPCFKALERLRAYRDHTGNPDFIAGRIISMMIFEHPWPPSSETEWFYEEREDLIPILESVADQTTGVIREQVFAVLRSAGVEQMQDQEWRAGL